MKKLIYGILIMSVLVFTALVPPVSAAETKMKPSAAELKRMSTFLSNFTEQGFMNLDIQADGSDELLHMGAPDAVPDLIRFGIRHNYINNYKSRIVQCKTKNCKWGSLVIDGKYVAESVKKYFDLDLKNRSVTESDPPYFYDGKLYHFDGSDGEATYYADVKEVSEGNGGVFLMTGELYNADDKTDRPATFEATAKPYKFGGRDTWAILSINTAWNEY
jgi:hypothetical protein